MSDNNFTEGKILPKLLKFTLPILAALFMQAAYGATDLIIVGKFGDATGTAAVGTGSAVMQLVMMIISGFTMGTTVVIGQYLGEKRNRDAGKTIGTSVVLFIIIAAILTALMEIFAVPLTRLMQTPEAAFDKTVQYVSICSAGIVFITAYNVISGIFRGLGNSKLPMLFVFIAMVSNIVGDLILVGLLGLDAAGAAIATIAAQAISVILSLIIIKRQPLPFILEKNMLRLERENCLKVLKIGAPIALQDSLVHFSFLFINAFVNAMGLSQSAGYGIAERVTAFIFLVPSAIMSGVSAFVAQNVGAERNDRAKKTMYISMSVGSLFGILLFCTGFFGGGLLSKAFSNDADAILESANYLKGFSADCILTCVLFSFIGYFSGNGKTTYVMAQGITSSFLLRVPLSFIFSKVGNSNLVLLGTAAPLASVYGIIFCLICYKIMDRRAYNGH